jgi:Tol biopolymer transport system component
VAFTKFENRLNVWSRPFDLNRGVAKGDLEQVTEDLAFHKDPSLSANGRYLAFSSDQSGHFNIRLRELPAKRESALAESVLLQRFPVSNVDGSRVAYSLYEKDKRVVYASALGEAPEKLCEGCLRVTDWAADDKSVLIFGGNPYQVSRLDLSSHRQTLLISKPGQHVLYARFSPDNRWISFTIRTKLNRGRIAIAPIDGARPVPESAWISIAEEGTSDWANWSPDGKTLYFTSERDGHDCLWAQRLEPVSHRPAADAFPVQHLHGRLSYADYGWSAAGDRIAIALEEIAGSVWMMSPSGAH